MRGLNSDNPKVFSCSAVLRLLPCLHYAAKIRQKALLKYLSVLPLMFVKSLRLAGWYLITLWLVYPEGRKLPSISRLILKQSDFCPGKTDLETPAIGPHPQRSTSQGRPSLRPRILSTVVLNSKPGDTAGCHTWGRCYRNLVSRGQGCCKTSHNAQARPPQQRITRLKTPAVLKLRAPS